MSKYKLNLFCGDNLEPSSSALNETKHVQWTYDGSGEANIYVSQQAINALNDTSGKPTNIWLLESKQIPYTEINIEEKNISREKLVEISGAGTVPQIIIHDKPIGGFDKLLQLEQTGELNKLL